MKTKNKCCVNETSGYQRGDVAHRKRDEIDAKIQMRGNMSNKPSEPINPLNK